MRLPAKLCGLLARLHLQSFDRFISNHVAYTKIDTTNGRVEANITTNASSSPGFITLLVDHVTTTSVFAHNLGQLQLDPRRLFGVSLSLDTNMVQGVHGTIQLRVISEVVKRQASLVHIDCKVFEDSSDKLIAQGTHVKYM